MPIDVRRGAKIALVALLVASAIGAGKAADKRPLIRTIGIVADWSDYVYYIHRGFAFSNREQRGSIPEWEMDRFLSGELEVALKQHYELRPIAFAKGSIAPDPEKMLFWSLPSPKDSLRAQAKPANGEAVDAFIVIWPFIWEWVEMDAYLVGPGLFTRSGSMFPGKNGAWVYATGVISLVDGRTFEDIDECPLDGEAPALATTRGFTRRADDLKDVGGLEELTPEQMQKLETGIKALMREEITHCLRELRLVQ
jgi:hypothetical protein